MNAAEELFFRLHGEPAGEPVTEPIVKLTNVIKTYGKGDLKIAAIDNINLEIEQGKIVTIMGPSGSG